MSLSKKKNKSKDKSTEDIQELLSFDSKDDKANFLSTVIQMDFLDEVQKFLDNNEGWSRSKLAKELGVSKSFISQLFSGDKSFFNKNLIGKLQIIFGAKIVIRFETPYKPAIFDLGDVDKRLIVNEQPKEIIKEEYSQVVSGVFNRIDFSELNPFLPT